MIKALPIPQYFMKSVIKFAGIGFVFCGLTAATVAFFLSREQMSSDLQETGVATARAFHDRILDGDIRFVEPQIRSLLKIRPGESAQILNPDLTRVYKMNDPGELVQPCPALSLTYFDGWFGTARILIPVTLGAEDSHAARLLYISKRMNWNWGFVLMVFSVFTIGYMGLLYSFYQLSERVSTELGNQILNWSNQLKSNPKTAASESTPPFAELEPLQAALVGLNAQIERFEKTATDKARLTLLRGIAHDLLTPVARAQLYLSTLKRSLGEEAHEEVIAEMSDALSSVAGIASQVKTLNDLDAPHETTELVAATKKEVLALQELALVKEKSIQLEFAPTLPSVTSPFSKTEVSRILVNLVQNAVNASASSSSIQIQVGGTAEMSFLSVQDVGCGIPEDAQPRVFDPDFTLKPNAGTGLGLAIVKYICDRRQAKIELKSKISRGTTVTIWMPRLEAANV